MMALMPVYRFRNLENGEVVARYMPATDVPAIGACLATSEGRLKRMPSQHQTRGQFVPFIANAIPRNTSGFDHDAKGRCICKTQAQLERYRAAAGMEWGGLSGSDD